MAVALTRDGEDSDLDLTIFTPSQSTGVDMAHIGGAVTSDRTENYLVSDNVSLCEVIYLNTGETGNFKVYVNDYTNSMAGNYTADRRAALNVHVYIYNGNGLEEEYAYPSGQNGVVWEVEKVNGLTVTPGREYIRLSGESVGGWRIRQKNRAPLDRHMKCNYGEWI